MNWKHGLIVALTVLALGASSTARADLATTITNGDFEDAAFASLTGFVNVDPPGWTRMGGTTLIWNNPEYAAIVDTQPEYGPPLPSPLSGNYSGGLLSDRTQTGPNLFAGFYQSLGEVGAADVGKSYSLSADFTYRSYTYSWGATMAVAFSDDPLSFSTLGTPGLLAIDTLNTTAPIETLTATYTPGPDDVGQSIFAFVYIQTAAGASSFQEQYIVDDIGISVVPEPSSYILVACGMSAVMLLKGRRRKQHA